MKIFLAFVQFSCDTAISINVVISKPKAYETRQNGGLGSHWNFAFGLQEMYKFVCVAKKSLFPRVWKLRKMCKFAYSGFRLSV